MTTYYVSTTGNDSNSGTLSSPWKTIQKAANTLVAGDTVYIRGGTYKEYITPVNSGNSTASYITYTSYPGETAIIDLSGMSQTQSAIFTFNTKNYIKISGLTLQNNNPVAPGTVVPDGLGNEIFGISIGGGSSNLIIENNVFNNIASSAVWSYGSSTTPNTYITIDGNTLIDVGCRLVSFTGWTRGVHEGFSIYYTNNYEIKNNKLTRVWTEGMSIGYSNHGRIHHNYVPAGVPNVNTRCCNLMGIYASGEDDVEIYNNRVDGRDGGIGSAAEGPAPPTTNFRIYNNVITNSTYNGIIIALWGATSATWQNVYIVNNTIVNSGGIGINLQAPGTYQNVVLRNNLLSGNNTQITATLTGVVVDYNLFNGSTSVTGTSYINGDPKFVSPTDFHLQSTSPAIDKGSSTNAPSIDFDNVSRPQGAGFDIGAYEYSTAPACTQPAVAFTLS